MRLLSLAALALIASTACNGGNTEVCDDTIDNDENGLVDCADSACADAANCGGDTGTGTGTAAPGVDNDGDGFSPPTDCDDNNADINPDADASMATCGDGIDVDCDGNDDCVEVWGLKGAATVDATAGTYAGTTTMYDVALVNPDQIFCEMVWPVVNAAPPPVDCADCDFAFSLSHGSFESKSGALCDTWYQTDLDAGPEPLAGGTFAAGYAPSYDFTQDTDGPGPAFMMAFDVSDTAATTPQYQWYGVSKDVAFSGADFTWDWTINMYFIYY